MPIKKVSIIKNWDFPDLLRQTPKRSGRWGDYQFTTDPIEKCDYAIVLNQPASSVVVECPPDHVWAVMQEPPNEYHRWMHRGQRAFARIYTSDDTLRGGRFIQSQPALPWHVNKDYDYLKRCGIPEKTGSLSWVTSNLSIFSGHRRRLAFLEKLRQSQLPFDLFGKGFVFVEDKWDGLAPYRYSLAIENFKNPYYWSEKLADCFLAWCMPIYYGCTRITEYFPSESMIVIDVQDPQAIEKAGEAIQNRRWEKNLDAIAEARKLVLEKYQFFPYLVNELNADDQRSTTVTERQVLHPRKERLFSQDGMNIILRYFAKWRTKKD